MTLPLLLASAAQPGIAETFGLETKYIIMQVISFLVVLGVLYKFGIKPTVGRISRYGVIPITADQDTPGPMARTVTDAAIMLGAMASHDPKDSTSVPRPVPDYEAVLGKGIKGLKFGVTAPGSSTHMLLLSWAAKGGLKASDVTAIGVGAGASVVAAIENKSVDGVSQTDPALTMLEDKGLIQIVVDTRTTKGNQEVFGGAFPAACLYAQPNLLTKTPNTALALATGIVRADEWLQTAKPAEVANTVPEAYLLGDRAIYEKSFAGVRETISPDGLMPAGAQENCLKFLVEADPKLAADKDKIKLADTWTNEFAERAKKRA